MRYRAVVAYDGTNYSGFQRQGEEATIQKELEQSIEAVSAQRTAVVGAGRTDAGVHALGQVIAFQIAWRHSNRSLLQAVNANLPDDISLQELDSAPEEFHPRYDAKRRHYRYRIFENPIRSPWKRLYSWHVKTKLNIEAMDEAAGFVLGEHDFAAFGRPPQGEVSRRTVFKAHWHQSGDILNFEIEANAFLYKMVRSLVGTMKLVGEGKWTVMDFKEALESCDRGRAGKTAPPHGLFFVSVSY